MMARLQHRRRKHGMFWVLLGWAVIWGSAAAGMVWAEDHWAFKPVVRPAIPEISPDERAAANNPIDHFIIQRLRAEGLSMSPKADRRTLIRRVYMTLIGLPPSREAMDRFLSDRASGAYERLVDELLGSPRYGERWARHWLDVVRFAESHGFETNLERKNAWPYRDYVIEAFNEDRPYDRFVWEQIAGDLVGEDVATGFLVAGPWDAVKSPDVELTAQQRMDELHDMVSTTGTAFLGLTVGCARCHDHKFDPISQVDYYSMQAVFAGVQHGERPWAREDAEGKEKRKRRVDELLMGVREDLWRYVPQADPVVEAGEVPVRVAVNSRLNLERFAPVRVGRLRFRVEKSSDVEPCIDELEVYGPSEPGKNLALASLGVMAEASGTYAGDPHHKLEHINDGRVGNSYSWISSEPGRGWVELRFVQPVVIDRVIWARDRNGKYADRVPVEYAIEVQTAGEAGAVGSWVTVASSADRALYKAGADFAEPYTREGLTPADERERDRLLALKRQYEAELARLSSAPMAYVGRFEAPGRTYVLHRGEPLQKRALVKPDGIRAIGGELELKEDALEQDRRRALADWLVSSGNPLTARVIVNRLWHYHFGEGLVSTPSDFGRMGSTPSHPELLDWLASELMAREWSLKSIQRLIVLSGAYRQSSRSDERGSAVDVAGRLLWRFPPRRLEAEAIRDSMLVVSGRINYEMGGPGFDLFLPNGNYVKVYTPKDDFGPDEWRRMVYQARPRNQLDNTFGAFDCPDGAQIAPRRNRSVTPLQALNLLNSPFSMQQARYFAERLRAEQESAAGQVREGFRLAFGRRPDAVELEAGLELIEEHGVESFCRALFNASEFLYLF